MNLYQFVRQAKYLLKAETWPDGSAQRVFAPESVRVTAGPLDPEATDLRFPLCLIEPGEPEADPTDPDLVRLRITVSVAAQMEGGDVAERVLVGGPRTTGQGVSIGRGVLELAERVQSCLGRLTGIDGVRAVMRHLGGPAATPLGDGGYLAAQSMTFEALGTTTPHYENHRFLAASDRTGGVARLTWVLAPARFDMFDGSGTRLKPVIRYASGATAPTSVSGGTGVTIASATDETVDVTTGAGTFSFSLFAAYTESGQASAEKYSDIRDEHGTYVPDNIVTVVVT